MADNRDSIVVMGRSQILWHDEEDSAFERVITKAGSGLSFRWIFPEMVFGNS